MSQLGQHGPAIHRPKKGDGSLPKCAYCIKAKKGRCFYCMGSFTCDPCTNLRHGKTCSEQDAEDLRQRNAALANAGSVGGSAAAQASAGGFRNGPWASYGGGTDSFGQSQGGLEDTDMADSADHSSSVPTGAESAEGFEENRFDSLGDRMKQRGNLGARSGRGGARGGARGGSNMAQIQGQAESSSAASVGQPRSMERLALDLSAGRGPIPRVQPENQPNATGRPMMTCCTWSILDNRREGNTKRGREFGEFFGRIRGGYPDFCLKGSQNDNKAGKKGVYKRFNYLFVIEPRTGAVAARVFGTDNLLTGKITELLLDDHPEICFEHELDTKPIYSAMLVQYFTYYSSCTVPYADHFLELRISLTKYRPTGQKYISPYPSKPQGREVLVGPAHKNAAPLEKIDLDAVPSLTQGSQRVFGPAPPPGFPGQNAGTASTCSTQEDWDLDFIQRIKAAGLKKSGSTDQYSVDPLRQKGAAIPALKNDPFMGAPALGDEFDADFEQFKTSGFKGSRSSGPQGALRQPRSSASSRQSDFGEPYIPDHGTDPQFDQMMYDLFPALAPALPQGPRAPPRTGQSNLDDGPSECTKGIQ